MRNENDEPSTLAERIRHLAAKREAQAEKGYDKITSQELRVIAANYRALADEIERKPS